MTGSARRTTKPESTAKAALWREHFMLRMGVSLILAVIVLVGLQTIKACAASSLDNWHTREFNNLEQQKKLDKLRRDRSSYGAEKRRKTKSKRRVKKKRKPARRRKSVVRKKPVLPQKAQKPAPIIIVKNPKRLQICLQKTGYLDGEASGRLDKPTRRAFIAFRKAQKLPARKTRVYGNKSLRLLYAACLEKTLMTAGANDKNENGDEVFAKSLQEATRSAPARSDPMPFPGEAVIPGQIMAMPPLSPVTTAGLAAVAGQRERRADAAPEPVRLANVSEYQKGASGLSPLSSRYSASSSSSSSSMANSSSTFPRRLSIGDLKQAGRADPNACTPANHAADDAPIVTSALGAGNRRNGRFTTHQHSALHQAAAETERNCLPEDLYNLLQKNRGADESLTVCKADCQPVPRGFSKGQKQVYARQYDIDWCNSKCLGIGAPLPLREVMKIEHEARVHVCMAPHARLIKARTPAKSDKHLQALFDGLPGGYGNRQNIAVLIGNNYGAHSQPGHANLAAMKTLLLEQLGYQRGNVIISRDADKKDLERIFGTRRNHKGELHQRLSDNPNSQLMIYFSGFASSSGAGLDNALLSANGKNGYKLSVLYDNLRRLDARSTQLFLEASFNEDRSNKILVPNVAVRQVNIAPLSPVRGLTVFAAATGDQKPLVDAETGLSLFTRYLISGLAGAADEKPLGNGDRMIDSVELHVHLAAKVRLAARKTLGLMQSPVVSRSDTRFLSQLSRARGR